MSRVLASAPEALFWWLVNERHLIYLKKSAGEPKPWTADSVLQSYKFTNIFRQLDTGTQWLIKNFLIPHAGDDPALIAFNICWYREFNWIGTGELLGWQTSWRQAAIKRKLQRARDNGAQTFTGAHITFAPRGMSKIDGVVEICSNLWKVRRLVVNMARFARTKRAVFDVLTSVDGVGDFMAGEMISDMCYTPILSDATDLNTWIPVGPGAWRGLKRLSHGLKRADAVKAMVALLHRSDAERGSHVPPMCLRDIAMTLCEFDKLCRVKFCEGSPRSRYDGRG